MVKYINNSGKYSLLFSFLFAISYGLAPLYTSNQNTYFFHGLADAGKGFLELDWLAGTADPFPVFSFLINISFRIFPEWIFYLYHLSLLILYFNFLFRIILEVFPDVKGSRQRHILALILIIIHSALLGFLSLKIFNINLNQLFTYGLANQYVLGPGLQPSVFGVFLLASIYYFLREKYALGIVFMGITVYFHSSYLIISGLLILAVMLSQLTKKRNLKSAISIGLSAGFIILPLLLYIMYNFSPETPELTAKAQAILVNERIPHHASMSDWFNSIEVLKIVIIIISLFIIRRTKLFIILATIFIGSSILTLIQWFTGSNQLALLFPWRSSVILMTLGMGIIIGYFVTAIMKNIHLDKSRTIIAAAFGGMILLACSGTAFTINEFKDGNNEVELGVMQYVKEYKHRNDLYLIPPDLEKFRIHTGARTFVDAKTHPYKDVEFLEWYKRLKKVEKFYRMKDWSDFNIKDILEFNDKYGVTHFITEAGISVLDSGQSELEYSDDYFSLYRILP